ncbi:thiol:disulfide interchange protein DsbA/DsbL [Marinihelvus fidelis]|nr:thiol:disulfide interchange protein DsbA/DsbL [Marinihelvus fidelis]
MIKTLLTVISLAAASFPAWAQSGAPFEEGKHYFTIEQPEGYRPIDGVKVTEVFSYLCSHCASFEPYIENWHAKQPESVQFDRIPVEFGRAIWSLYARAYVTASVLGIENASHKAMMDIIWKDKRQMRNMDELAEFYSQFGVDAEKFVATSKSFAVDMRMKREQQQVRQAGVSGTPSMLVNGKYRVSAGGAVSGFDQMLAVVDYLVAQEMATESVAQVATPAQ